MNKTFFKEKLLRHKTVLWVILWMILCSPLFGQDDNNRIPAPEWKGYVKYLSNTTNLNLPFYEELLTNQLIHQRLNMRWDLKDNLVLHGGWRNQLYFGELVKSNPQFGPSLLERQDDYFHLSSNPIDNNDLVYNTTVDRFYMEYYRGNLEIAIGRQRVNWGINTIWNPNDIFNTYSFVDFDYEERPGSDAINVRYYLGDVSSIEFAAKIHGEKEKMVMAGLWKFNRSDYDFQLLGGYANGFWTLGGGWAGNLGNAGWKGEWTWFKSDIENIDNTFLITTAVDYSFANSWYISGGYLYNHSGSSGTSITELLTFDVSAQNIYPYRHAILLTNSYPVTPLFNTALTIVYTPNSSHPMFISPVFSYSVAQDWDLDLTGQIGLEKGDSFYSPLQAFFLRMRYSY